MRASLIVAMVVLPSLAVSAPQPPLAVVASPPQDAPGLASVLYLDRCRGGCTITRGDDDARARRSSIPDQAGPFTLDEFDWGDAAWDAMVHCVREVYSPYAVTVTDVQPAPGVKYNTAIVAGTPQQLGMTGIAGIALLSDDCSPYFNVLSFVFANASTSQDTQWLCYAVAQETGHAAGLDHVYGLADGSSGCRDPMSYRNDCGGQRFFRPRSATCGEHVPRSCACGGMQASHEHLLSVFGPGTPITSPPTVDILLPAADGAMSNRVLVSTQAQRGVDVLELWLNGTRWARGPGAPWGPTGQLDTAKIEMPFGVPDGIIDVTVVAIDDLGFADAATVTATKGLPCESAATCLLGQRCEAGRCFWDPAVGELGDACEYGPYCKSSLCIDSVCTQTCNIANNSGCPSGFTCSAGYPEPVCRPFDLESGCCDASGTPHGALGFLLLVLVLRTRRLAAARYARPRGEIS